MARYWIKILEGIVEIENAEDEGDAKQQALDLVEMEVVEVGDGDDDEEDEDDVE